MIIKIIHLLERFVECCKMFPQNIKEFGIVVAALQFWDVLIPLGKSKTYIETLSRYVCDELKPIIDAHNEGRVDCFLPKVQPEKTPVWVCWWQGESAMPPIVCACVSKLRRCLPENAELKLITWENLDEYVQFPPVIYEKYKRGLITRVHLTDILRYYLVGCYGGAWIDATVFAAHELDHVFSEYLTCDYYTQRYADWASCPREACRGKWCNFFFMGKKETPLFELVYMSLIRWWEKHDHLIDYVMVDYVIWALYSQCSDIRACIDAVLPNNKNIWQLEKHLNDAYTPEAYAKLLSSNGFFKLSYKGKLEMTTASGEKTIYAHILEENLG